MDLRLLDSLACAHYPEESSGSLEVSGIVTCCQFNRWGSLLACGCNDGRVAIFDFITRWSRNGRRLAAASSDHTVSVSNVLSGEVRQRLRFPAIITAVQLHPIDESKLLVCLVKYPPTLVNLYDNSTQTLVGEGDAEPGEQFSVACFERCGQYVLTGSSKGKVCVYSLHNGLQLTASFRLPSAHATKSLTFASRVDHFMTINNDRIVRVYDFREVLVRGINSTAEPVQKLQDMVNKTPWRACCMSGNGDYVCAGSARSVALYIWERNTGSLVKILQGAKGETLNDVQWHPARSVICSVANGAVNIWAQSHVENWSAFAPDFRELEENVVYDERESEFDFEDEDKSVKADDEKRNEDIDVDVTNVSDDTSDEELGVSAASASEDEKPLYYIPQAPDIEHDDAVNVSTTSAANTSGGDIAIDDATLSPRRGNRPKTVEIHLQRPPSAAEHARSPPLGATTSAAPGVAPARKRTSTAKAAAAAAAAAVGGGVKKGRSKQSNMD